MSSHSIKICHPKVADSACQSILNRRAPRHITTHPDFNPKIDCLTYSKETAFPTRYNGYRISIMEPPVPAKKPSHIFATALITLLSSGAAIADHMEELIIIATHDTRSVDVNSALVISPDASAVLKNAPGADVNGNGPLTGIAQYRGLYGSRIATALDGHQLAPAGPNWMDPPLSYAAAGQLESLELYRGIAPVSVAQESIGGAISVTSDRGTYSESGDFELSGRLIGSAQSINAGTHFNAAVFAANNSHRIKLAAMSEAGDDARFPDGDITPSEYERQRYDIGYGFQQGRHSLQLDYSYTDTGDAGTAALPMDIQYIEGDMYSLDYSFALTEDLNIEASIYGSDLGHGMTNYHLREAPAKGLWRRNLASSDNAGFKLQARSDNGSGSWIAGIDSFSSEHDSNIDNPNNPMFFVVNFNQAEREVTGVFLERQHNISAHWIGEFGIRYNRVTMDAGEVNGTPAIMMPPAQALRDAFNNADRHQTDNNTDLVAKLWYRPNSNTKWYAGIAQKHRSASYQERYLWLPLEATAGLADGMTYTGNMDLDPEVSRQIEAGLDLNWRKLSLSPRLFYNAIDDYIQGTPSEVAPAVMFVRMMNINNDSSRPDPLQFNNVDAQLYGLDMDWALQFTDQWSVTGIVNYVRGQRDDIEDNLYRIAPPNTSFRLNYNAGSWFASAESVLYAKQDKVSATNMERETAGYGVVNLRASWQAQAGLQLAAGLDNLFDKGYKNHLGGYNRAGNEDIAIGERLPGYGRNAFVRVSYEF
jgi:iron complex outermembrane receptor protein